MTSLTGSPKQIQWAESIIAQTRRSLAETFTRQRQRHMMWVKQAEIPQIKITEEVQRHLDDVALIDRTEAAYSAILERIIASHGDASWWIDHRGQSWRDIVQADITADELSTLQAIA